MLSELVDDPAEEGRVLAAVPDHQPAAVDPQQRGAGGRGGTEDVRAGVAEVRDREAARREVPREPEQRQRPMAADAAGEPARHGGEVGVEGR
jgi:hypothetical protein